MTTKRWSRLAEYLVVAVLAIAMTPLLASADTIVTHTVTVDENTNGQEVALDGGAKVILFPNAITTLPVDLTWQKLTTGLPASLPPGTKQIGNYYQLDVTGAEAWNPTASYMPTISLPYTPTLWTRNIWVYDWSAQTWSKLTTKTYASKKMVAAPATKLHGMYVVLEQTRTQEGVASWYCKKHCSARYPTLHGTSNAFPIGSYVTVLNPANGKNVRVKIVSTWGQPAGRVIDLSYAAFAKLGSANGGLVKVRVTTLPLTTATKPAAKPTTAQSTPAAPDPTPSLSVTRVGTGSYPGSSVAGYMVMDEGTGKILAEKMATTRRSIASITKLMTAAVFLDYQADLSKVVTYTSADKTDYAYLKLNLGDSLTMHDLLNATLVGSANNGAAMLARVSGLSKAEFLKKMNDKAKSYGMTQTTFTDPHGLGSGNTSTARDLALLGSHVFSEYPLIRVITAKKAFDFTTVNTGKAHHIASTDKLLLHGPIPSPLTFSGAKTGFTDEALYTYVIRFRTPAGAKIVVSILGAKNADVRYGDATALARWAWTQYTWK